MEFDTLAHFLETKDSEFTELSPGAIHRTLHRLSIRRSFNRDT